jgi:hypothetical protein
MPVKRGRAVVVCVWHVIGTRLCGPHLVRKVGPRNLFIEPGPCVERASAIRLSRQRIKGRNGLSRKSVEGRFYATEQAAIFAALAASASIAS